MSGNITSTDGGPLFDPANVRVEETLDGLLADRSIDFVSVCTPTDTHVAIVERALAAGKHVIVEKPVALEAGAVRALADRARAANRIVMPAMCMRFWPGWRWLFDQVREGTLGSLLSLSLVRVGAPPSWSRDFYFDDARSGGAIVDLHIHDVDCVRWLFGRPTSVSTVGSARHLSTSYQFEGGPALVTAEGGWLPTAGASFEMSFRACFERGVARFDLGSDPILTLEGEGEPEHPAIPEGDGYDGEIRHFVESLRAGRVPEATLDEAAEVMEIIAAERESLACGTRVDVPPVESR